MVRTIPIFLDKWSPDRATGSHCLGAVIVNISPFGSLFLVVARREAIDAAGGAILVGGTLPLGVTCGSSLALEADGSAARRTGTLRL